LKNKGKIYEEHTDCKKGWIYAPQKVLSIFYEIVFFLIVNKSETLLKIVHYIKSR
jgi:hypothetical protein